MLPSLMREFPHKGGLVHVHGVPFDEICKELQPDAITPFADDDSCADDDSFLSEEDSELLQPTSVRLMTNNPASKRLVLFLNIILLPMSLS